MLAILHTALYVFYLLLFVFFIKRWKGFTTDEHVIARTALRTKQSPTGSRGLLWKPRNDGDDNRWLIFFFLLKVAAGILLTLIYTYYYTDPNKADIYRYFNDSKIISRLLFTNPVAWLKIISGIGINEPAVFKYVLPTQYFSHPGADVITNNTFIIRVNVLLNYFSFTNIFINTLFLNFISFMGLVALGRALQKYFVEGATIVWLPLFLIPSVVFWGSGMLKEQLLFAGIGFYLYVWLKKDVALLPKIIFLALAFTVVALNKLPVAVVLLVCSIFLPVQNLFTTKPFGFHLKEWLLLAFCPHPQPLSKGEGSKSFSFGEGFRMRICAVVNYLTQTQTTSKKQIAFVPRLVFAVVVVSSFLFFFHQPLCEKLMDKRNEFIALAIQENSGSYLHQPVAGADCANLLSILPSAMVNVVLRPFVWEPGSMFEKLFAIENGLLLLALAFLLLKYFKPPVAEKLLVSVFFLLFALFNYLVIGITVPIMGAIVHYRVIAIPFLAIGVLMWVEGKGRREW